MKFNLQHFALVEDVFGDKVAKKKRIVPKIPTIPKAVAAVTVPEDEPFISSRDAAAAGTAANPNTGQKLGTFEEGQAQWEKLRADTKAEIDARTPTKTLEDAIVKQEIPRQQVQQGQQGPSIADQLTQQSNAATQSLLAQLKQRIADDIAGQQQVIARAPQQFDPFRAQSEVAKSQQLRSALERSSVLGDRGGIGRSEALATQTAGENRLTDINLQQQNVIDDANAQIQSLKREGRFEEARIKADQTNRLLAALTNEQIRQEGITRQDTIRQDELGREATAQQRSEFIQTLPRFGQDFTAEIQRNQNDGDPSNDWQIPLLETARQEKITSQNLDPATGQPLPVDATPTLTSSSALDLWEQTGVANEAVSRALGIPVGTRYTRQAASGTGGTSTGLSSASIATNARYKITNGIPLSAEEARVFGVTEGYVDPNFEGAGATGTTTEGLSPTVSADLNQYIQQKGGNTQQAVIEYLINNDGNYSVADGYAILDAYGLSPEDLQRIVNVNPSIGQ